MFHILSRILHIFQDWCLALKKLKPNIFQPNGEFCIGKKNLEDSSKKLAQKKNTSKKQVATLISIN